MRKMILAAALALMASGCGAKRITAEPPTERLAASQTTLRAAEEGGAAQVPEAATYLAFAQQQVATAQQLMSQGRYEAADLQLQQAAADAQLALTLARAVPMENEARRMLEQVEALRGNPR
jgi:Domain of unknown function (DUF4398)